jgi:glycosyltransferase involved in cell wall biosynthesis
VLAGDAQGRAAFESELLQAISMQGLRDSVVIAGHVSDMPAAYLATDIVVSASLYPESFGRTTTEAGAMLRPVIATDHGGARETVLRGISGILVPPADAHALANALRELIAMGPEGRAAMGAKGREFVVRHYTVGRMCEDTLAVYRSLLAAGK